MIDLAVLKDKERGLDFAYECLKRRMFQFKDYNETVRWEKLVQWWINSIKNYLIEKG